MILLRARSAIAVLVIGVAVLAVAGETSLAHPVPPTASAEGLTPSLIALEARYQHADPADQVQLAGHLLSVATARWQLLAALVESDPGAVLRAAVPAGLRAGLPPAVQAYVEEEAELEGTLEILHQDQDPGSRYLYFLDTALERLSLHFAADPPALKTGAWVRARGVRVGRTLALSSGSTSVQTLAPALPNTFGPQKTLVILVNFQDKATEPYTVAYAESTVFTTTSNFHLDNSYGQTSLTGDVYGWFTIPLSSTVCNYSTLATYAKQAAAAAGADLSAYNRYVYAFPNNACSWWGLGTVGGNPSQAWVNGSFQLRVVGHEMGHNLGLYHSHSLSCDLTACSASDYGDGWDIMGGSSAHFNAFQKERLGWLNYASSPPITTVEASGAYWLAPYESLGFDPKALKILKSTDPTTGKKTWYYVEYRARIGFDSAVAGGVLLHTGSESSANSSYLWDTAPTTSTVDWVLDVSESFHDPDAAVTITTLSADSTGAAVNVTVGPTACVRTNPAVALSPSASQSVGAGTTVTYTVTVTNRDHAACASSTFGLQASVPVGWTAALASSALSLGPGGSSSTTLRVTSPTSALGGTYTIGVSATNTGTSGSTGSASATYVIVSCAQANPTVTLSPSASQSVGAGTTVTYTVTVTNHDNAACVPSTFSLQANVPLGWMGTLATSALTLSPGGSGSTTLQVTSPASTLGGTYTIGVSATNSAEPTYTAAASAIYMVVSALTVTVRSDQPSYTLNDWAVITATVSADGSPVANASVTFTVTRPDGAVVTRTDTTGTDGAAAFKLRLKRQDPVGTYHVKAAANLKSAVSGESAFEVQEVARRP